MRRLFTCILIGCCVEVFRSEENVTSGFYVEPETTENPECERLRQQPPPKPDVNECEFSHFICPPNSLCENTPGSFICHCILGYEWQDRTASCVEVLDCARHRDDCDGWTATCTDTVGSYRCECKPKQFVGDGKHCEYIDADDCNIDCPTNTYCSLTSFMDGYFCPCQRGYEKAPDGSCVEMDECQWKKCHSKAICIDLSPRFRCQCIEGYEGNGVHCQDVNECITKQHDCHANAKCDNLVGSYECTCKYGYVGDGKHCSPACPVKAQLHRSADTLCERHRHRIVALDETPGIGRVEIMDARGQWWAICDNLWDHLGAALICKCLGYEDTDAARPYSDPSAATWPRNVSVGFSSVRCQSYHLNLWECETTTPTGLCTSVALVACERPTPGMTSSTVVTSSAMAWSSTMETSSAAMNYTQPSQFVGLMLQAARTNFAKHVVSCNVSRHRLRPINAANPGIGRVEVSDEDGFWSGVCDDFWNAVAAAVFCRCIGFNDTRYAMAYSLPSAHAKLPPIPLAYDYVMCTEEQAKRGVNLWDCDTAPSSGRCDPAREAALVKCVPLTEHVYEMPKPETLNVTCSESTLGVCFNTTVVSIDASLLRLVPSCPSTSYTADASTVCYEIDIQVCTIHSHEVTILYKYYCYHVTHNGHPRWSISACCARRKNATVGLAMNYSGAKPSYSEPVEIANLAVACFADSMHNALTYPIVVQRGQYLSCRVTAGVHDEHSLLVVPNCWFFSRDGGPNTMYYIIRDKCSALDSGMQMFSETADSWRVRFTVPDFNDNSRLYISCDVYVCDTRLDPKPYCDRTCLQDATQDRRRKRRQTLSVGNKTARHVRQGPFIIRGSVHDDTEALQSGSALSISSLHAIVVASVIYHSLSTA